MCGILAILDLNRETTSNRELALRLARRMRHRGPDWSGIHESERAILAHERLAIVDVECGAQPLYGTDRKTILAVNGEIYNHRDLEQQLEQPYNFQTGSDCEVILPLFEQRRTDFLNELNGIFAFVLHDDSNGQYLIARDPIGVMPLYYGHDELGQLYVASEMKAIVDVCKTFQEFPPGHYMTRDTGQPQRYYEPAWRAYEQVRGRAVDLAALRDSLEAAVKRQLMCDVPYGVLLSGGLDSSILAAIAHHYYKRRIEDEGQGEAWWPQLHSFAIGLHGSPDLVAAQLAADAIGTIHHAFEYTPQEGLDALSDVIHHIETFDVTTVRASTPMYLLARRIKAMGIKMVITGEGSDEIFGGYLYFHKAPNAREFHEENVRKLDQLHLFDCLRANKSLAAWGVEGRVPFLDRDFLDVAMGFDAKHKLIEEGRIEKQVLREAFKDYLPQSIVWRQKEQFSDGVGYSWIDSLKQAAEEYVSDEKFAKAAFRFPQQTPASKEAYMYRELFEQHFPGASAAACVPHGMSIACSTPTAIRWDAAFQDRADPSGRAIADVHEQAY